MERKGDTPSCRLAGWLQPDKAMDLDASELTLPMEPVKVGASLEFTLCTKDQDGKPVFVDDMKVCHSSLYCLLESSCTNVNAELRNSVYYFMIC